jgi:hypothetical protein
MQTGNRNSLFWPSRKFFRDGSQQPLNIYSAGAPDRQFNFKAGSSRSALEGLNAASGGLDDGTGD